MKDAHCPYCKADYEEENGHCKSCNEPFPWTVGDSRLRDEIKSREVNRGRATFTLIEEIHRAVNGGPRVSLAALKGFAFAWMYPRVIIAIGSIAMLAVVIIQTMIFYRQTELIQVQSDAAAVEKAARLQESISANNLLLSKLSRATGLFDFPKNLLPCDQKILPCAEEAASEILLVTERYEYPDSSLPKSDTQIDLLISSSQRAREIVQAELFAVNIRPSTARSFDSALDQAVVQCFYPPKKLGKVKNALDLLAAFGAPRDVWKESTYVRGLTAVHRLKEFVLPESIGEDRLNDIVSVEEFFRLHKAWSDYLRTELDSMQQLCTDVIQRDMERLEATDRMLIRKSKDARDSS